MSDIIDLLSSAKNNESNSDYKFYLSGDLCQMAEQKDFLLLHGFDVAQNGVYPSLKSEDVKSALGTIWSHRCPGWWHYEETYCKKKICTKEEFDKALGRT
jgi:hypothetical protein